MMKARRSGFTLVELLIVVVIGALVLAAVYQTLITQERAIRQSYAVIGTQQNVRTAIQVIGADLRELSATDNDITAASGNSISLRALRKAGVTCNVDPSGAYIDVALWGDPFAATDSVWIFDDGANPLSSFDDTWIRRSVSSVSTPTTCAGNPISTTVRRLNLSSSVTTVIPGALVRSFVPVSYALVNSGGKGVLQRTQGGTTVDLVEDLATTANRGLALTYWDTAGTAIASGSLSSSLNRIGRIQVMVRGTLVGGQTGNNRNFVDSLFTTIQMRGNWRLR
jgi:prepilin-type N-terminal cleavage/methylation domain-containing protein